jgi:hypothetical protein
MKHLNETELIDLVEGALESSRASHADCCEACRAKVDELRETLTRTSDVDVPDPSPLFWEHFSARVREGVRHTAPDRSPSWLPSRGSLWWAASGAALLLLLVVAGLWRATLPGVTERQPDTLATNSRPEASPDRRDATAPIAVSDVNAVDNDAAWDLVRAAADEASWDDAMAAGLDARPGSAERVALTLTADERTELVRLLQVEAKRRGA